MKKIGIYLVIIGITFFAFYFMYNKALDRQAQDNVDDYIKDTSVINEVIDEIPVEEKEEKQGVSSNINYTAILEIPKIGLKRGVVDNTRNFNSINYAISVDNSSNYPNGKGNFILYSHSGNSSIAFFNRLYKLEINDDIYVYYNGIKYHYSIFKKYDIEKTGKAKVINLKDNKYITLITCNQNKKGYQIVIEGKIIDESNY